MIENMIRWAMEKLGERKYAGWCLSEDGPVNWGHCGISLGDGRVIHAWDVVRIDNYLDIEKLHAMSGDHPQYIGWVPVRRVLMQKA